MTANTPEADAELIAKARRLITSQPPSDSATDSGHPSTASTLRPAGVLASNVRPERVKMIWSGVLAEGKASVLDGDPGLGKSTLTLDIAARITTGRPMPGCVQSRDPRGVVLLSAEDGAADTIVPRLVAAGADLSRVFIMEGMQAGDGPVDLATLPGGLDAIQQAITDHDASLVAIDPIMAYLGADTNAHRDQDVRRALAPFAAMLEDTGCAGLMVRHLNKAQSASAIYRGGGSIGIIGAARFGILVARDPEDPDARIVASVKCNLGPEPRSLRYRLVGVPGSDVARIAWDDMPVDITATALLDTISDSGNERTEARDWLLDYLSGSAKPANDVLREGKRAGFSEITLKRAKHALGVKSTKAGFGQEGSWAWCLPDHETPPESPKGINEELSGSPPRDEPLSQSVIHLSAGGPSSRNGHHNEIVDAEYVELTV